MEELKEEVVEETTEQNNEQSIEDVVEKTIDEPKIESAGEYRVFKIDLSKPPPPKEESVKEKENIVKEPEIKEPEVKESETKEEVQEDVPVIEEITIDDLKESEVVEEKIEEAVIEAETTGKPLPENVQKLVDFMDETGGDINDYVNLNRDIEKMDDSDVLDEYYKQTKSHLTPEERSFLLEDSFGIDEDIDD